MRNLRLVGLSDDGRRVVFVDDAGNEFATPADDRLRAALRGDRARLGQLEIQMDSALRPRDIQARIRAGDTPEAVATLAQVSVERIMPFCVPVLAERQHIAELARRSHVRRKGTDGPARRLHELVAERLRSRGLAPDSAEWDAWRRDDGRWTVQTSYHSGDSERAALFTFDAMGRYSVAEDDEAKWLTGEKQSTKRGPQPREGGRGERRLSAVPDGDDLLSLSEGDAENTDDLTAVARAVREIEDQPGETAGEEHDTAGEAEQAAEEQPEAAEQTEADVEAEHQVDDGQAGDTSDAPEDEEQPDEDAEAPRKRQSRARKTRASSDPKTEPTPERKRKQKRASVPSWDEIMLGGKDKED